ncbi:hypothetical protein HaLaN_28303, partial [Haematococcus lacustris]
MSPRSRQYGPKLVEHNSSSRHAAAGRGPISQPIVMDATYTPHFASVLHSIHNVMTGAGARLVDVKCGRPIQVKEYEEFRFNTFEVAMVCMNALRRVHPTPPGLGSMWNSSGKKVIAQGLVTADWATLAAAIQQAKVTEDGTEASPTKLIQQGTEASSELA